MLCTVCSTYAMSLERKFTFAVSFSDEFLVSILPLTHVAPLAHNHCIAYKRLEA